MSPGSVVNWRNPHPLVTCLWTTIIFVGADLIDGFMANRCRSNATNAAITKRRSGNQIGDENDDERTSGRQRETAEGVTGD